MAIQWTQQARQSLCEAFNVNSVQAVQDILNSMLLSESVYRAYSSGPEAAAAAFRDFEKGFPPGLITVQRIQCSLPHVSHRYLVAASDDALYVAFMGTKAARDFLSDANYVQAAVWPALPSSAAAAVPMAHQGFLARAQHVPAEQLHTHAQRQSRRLVFCGHSLGGAVAKLCTLRLLRQGMPDTASVKCVSFAAPPLGNAALADFIAHSGWNGIFYNLTLPEDLLPRLLAMQRSAGLPAAVADAAQHASMPGEQHPISSELVGRAAEPAELLHPQRSWSEGNDCTPPVTEDVQKPFRLRLISGLDRLRAMTAHHAQRGDQEAPQQQQQQQRQQQQQQQQHSPRLQPGEPQHSEEPSSSGSTLQALASTASRFLPIYVPFGSQHTLPALPGAARLPARADTETEEGLDILAALEQQQQQQEQQDRQEVQQQQEEVQEGQASVLPPQEGLDQGQREEPQGGIDEGFNGAAAVRRTAYLLSHHRMFAIRERAAAACAGAARLGGAAQRAGSRPGVQLSDEVAPPLSISAAAARLAPLPPRMEPNVDRASIAQDRGGWAQWGWHGLSKALPPWALDSEPAADVSSGQGEAAARSGPQQPTVPNPNSPGPSTEAWWRWRRQAEAAQQLAQQPVQSDQPAPSSSSSSSRGAVSEGAADGAPWYGRLRWRPWDSGGPDLAGQEGQRGTSASTLPAQRDALQPEQDSSNLRPPSPGRDRPLWQRPWLPGWPSAAGGASADRQLGGCSSRLSILVSGRGLACCTSARVQVLSGAFLPARIVSHPPLPSLPAQPVCDERYQAAGSSLAPNPTGSQTPRDEERSWQRSGLQWGRALLSRVPMLSASSLLAQHTPGEGEEASEQLVLEVLLPPSIARSLADSLASGVQHPGTALEVQLRTDFHRRRARVQLQLPSAWVAAESALACRAVLESLAGSSREGIGGRSQQPFRQAICDNVSYVGLQADVTGASAASLPAVAQLVARIFQANTGSSALSASGEALPAAEGTDDHEAAAAGEQVPGAKGGARQRSSGIGWRAWAGVSSLVGGVRAGAAPKQALASAVGGLQARVHMVRHRGLWRSLQRLEPRPGALLLCLSDAARGNDLRAAADLARAAHAAAVPVVVVLLPRGGRGKGTPAALPAGLHAWAAAVLTLPGPGGGGGLSSADAVQLRRAVYNALTRSGPAPAIRSKL